MRRAAGADKPLLLTLALLAMASAGTRAEVAMTLLDGMSRAPRTGTVTGVDTLELHAARGEWEPLQVVLSGTPEELRKAAVEAAALTGPDGAKIPAPQIFREHFVRVSKSTPMSPLEPGDYPDALVPQDFPRQPLPAEKQVNQPFWVDVFVPYGTPAGRYEGRVKVAGKGGRSLAYQVQVHGFDMPVTPRLRTSIMTVWRRVAEVHGFDRNQEPPSAALSALLDQYYDLMARHRLAVDQTYPTYPEPGSGRLNEERVEAGMRKHLLHRHASTLGLPVWREWPFADPLGKDREAAMDYAARWMKLTNKLHCGGRGYVIMGDLDEPNSAAAYAEVRRWGEFFNEAENRHQVRIPLLVTEQPTPDDGWWGRLDGSVDIWVPHFGQVWQDLEDPKGPKDIARRLKAGDEVWCYAALVQMPEAWEKAHDRPKRLTAGNPPVWCLDYPAMNHRVVAWVMPRHGLTGLCYWDTLYASPGVDVWTDAGNFLHPSGDVYNGDGSYIYPATKKRHGRDMPVASIRLKWLREMAEDYDYLMLARDAGLEKDALELTATFARGFGDWEDSPAKLQAARQKLAALLEAKEQAKGGAR